MSPCDFFQSLEMIARVFSNDWNLRRAMAGRFPMEDIRLRFVRMRKLRGN